MLSTFAFTWEFWLVVALACFIIEIINAGFGIICFGFGALLSAVLAAFGLGLVWQLLGLAIGSFLAFLFIRPVILKWLDGNKEKAKTNLDNMEGRTAVVVEEVTETGGRAAIDGTDWKARSESGTVYPKDAAATIIRREGNTLIFK